MRMLENKTKSETVEYYLRVEHLLNGLRNGEALRNKEINALQIEVRTLIDLCESNLIVAQAGVDLIRKRIDHLAANPQSKGLYYQRKK